VEEIKVEVKGDQSVAIGKTITLTATVSNCDEQTVTWSSSEAEIATVENGVVTGIKEGTVTITATSIKDSTKKGTLEVTVFDPIAFHATENGSNKVEAEDLDLSEANLRSDLANAGLSFVESPSGDAAALTSGGKSIRGVSAGSVMNIAFTTGEVSRATFKGRFSNYDAGFVLDDNVTFKLDGVSLDNTNAVFGGHSSPADYWPWEDILLGDTILEAGEHLFTIEVQGSLPNADYFAFDIADYGEADTVYSVIDQDGDTTFEAESLDLTDLVIRPDLAAAGRDKESLIENATDASGGKSIGGIGAGTVLQASFYLKDEAFISPTVRMADAGNTYDVDANLEFTLDDEKVTSNGYSSFGSSETNTYWNWKDIELEGVVMAKGFHTFTYKAINNGINLDSFVLTASYYGDVASRGIQITDNGFNTIEAEDMVVESGGFSVESPSGEAASLTSGGKSIGNVKANTVFSISFNLDEKATVELAGIMAKYEDSFALDEKLEIKLDSEVITTGYTSFGHTDTNQYWNWKHVTLNKAVMDSGYHSLTIKALNENDCPNIDCFKIITTGFGDMFAVSEAKNVRVEGVEMPYNNLSFDSAGAGGRIESDSRSSGGKSLGHIAGGYIEIPFYVDMDSATLNLTLGLAKYEAVAVGDNYTLYLDGNQIAFTDPTFTLGRTDGNDWFNWKEVAVSSQTLTEGTHTFKLDLSKLAVSIDYFDFTFTA